MSAYKTPDVQDSRCIELASRVSNEFPDTSMWTNGECERARVLEVPVLAWSERLETSPRALSTFQREFSGRRPSASSVATTEWVAISPPPPPPDFERAGARPSTSSK